MTTYPAKPIDATSATESNLDFYEILVVKSCRTVNKISRIDPVRNSHKGKKSNIFKTSSCRRGDRENYLLSHFREQ